MRSHKDGRVVWRIGKNGYLWFDSSKGDRRTGLCTDMNIHITACDPLPLHSVHPETDWHTLHMIFTGLPDFLASS